MMVNDTAFPLKEYILVTLNCYQKKIYMVHKLAGAGKFILT